jgi:hypothetical protein
LWVVDQLTDFVRRFCAFGDFQRRSAFIHAVDPISAPLSSPPSSPLSGPEPVLTSVRTFQGLPSRTIFVEIAPTFFAIAISHQILWIATNAND